jgi:hypothetical protein
MEIDVLHPVAMAYQIVDHVKNAELEARAEIERLNNLLRLALDEKADVIKEIERLRADIRGRAEAFRRVEVEIIRLRNRVVDLEAGVARDRQQLAEVDAEGAQSGSETEIERLQTREAEWAMDSLRLVESLRYMIGIAERGFGRKIKDHETDRQFVLSYVQGLEAEIEQLRKKAGQRGARMQIMARFLRRSPEWWVMVNQHPDAPDWFDADGVPK